ncbi:hypothetical protein [Phenylobacterium montanum]|uniref:Uncharacterized protein n=1 Tax=Phenylobacterium montanum TaxID=2823693 RepID=A0A975FVJ9_9CAUL|nr:hypothetical protein [Caulobacter sp. S6]QUD86074.1 hypothetical protein KCG34_13265 [Caulobacter sp. S6]
MAKPTLIRLINLPGVRDLEAKALMNSRMADADAREHFPELDEVSRALFGLTADEADEAPRPEGWDRIERKPLKDQIAAFEAEGWDVTDDKLRPLRLFEHFNVQLWLAIRGVAGQLPHIAEVEDDFGHAALAADAARFRRDRR